MFNRKVLIRLVVIAGGVAILLLSLFAYPLGLDNDPGWGPRRFQILAAGLAIILFGALYWITPAISRRVQRIDKPVLEELQSTSYSKRTDLWLLLILSLAVLSYVWIISIGTMNKFPSGRDYYWMLAQAFQKGQTSLLVKPSPELLTLANPYDLSQRKEIDYLWDSTLYNRKYYLYWGPVPAVLILLSAASSPWPSSPNYHPLPQEVSTCQSTS